MFKIFDRRNEFFQWDLGQKLIVEDNSINQVHFCNRTDDCSLVCEVYDFEGYRVVDVPNVLLQTARKIKVYAYCCNYTKVEAEFRVIARTKPSDYVYTETEVKTFEALEARMAAVEKNGVPQDVLDAAIDDYFVANDITADITANANGIAANTKDIADIKVDIEAIEGVYASKEYVNNALAALVDGEEVSY